MYCTYYQARIIEKECWFLVAVMRSFEHVSFDRTVDKTTSTFEFFVPPLFEETFLEIMEALRKEGVVVSLERLENRLKDPQAVI